MIKLIVDINHVGQNHNNPEVRIYTLGDKLGGLPDKRLQALFYIHKIPRNAVIFEPDTFGTQ
jgi:hypothetical protein